MFVFFQADGKNTICFEIAIDVKMIIIWHFLFKQYFVWGGGQNFDLDNNNSES